jgi:hypothetical protein
MLAKRIKTSSETYQNIVNIAQLLQQLGESVRPLSDFAHHSGMHLDRTTQISGRAPSMNLRTSRAMSGQLPQLPLYRRRIPVVETYVHQSRHSFTISRDGDGNRRVFVGYDR